MTKTTKTEPNCLARNKAANTSDMKAVSIGERTMQYDGTENLENIVAKLEPFGRMSFDDGATEEDIAKFERNHFFRIPEKYREWLKFSDGGEMFLPGGVQLYGVAHAPLIETVGMFQIGALSNGDAILCDITGERIAIWNHETWRDEECFKDFHAFLNALPSILGLKYKK